MDEGLVFAEGNKSRFSHRCESPTASKIHQSSVNGLI
jgi:hypothetical protein